MPRLYRRRTFLQLVAAGGAAVSFPWLDPEADARVLISIRRPPVRRPSGPTEKHFFTVAERQLIEQMGEAICPEDQTVGARGTGAVEYIDRLLATFDNRQPTLFRGGPFSGRTPFPDARTGAPSRKFPENDFLDIIPPNRMQELAFRILLDGSDSVPNGSINAPLVKPTSGLRIIYKDGIAALNAAAQAAGASRFSDLDDEQKLAAFRTTSAEFQDALLNHIAEGMFCAPEYGGNKDLRGWRDYTYDGDSQPLGHTLFNRGTQTLFDRADQPNQIKDPHDPSQPGKTSLEPEVERFVSAIVLAQGGKRFF